MFSFFPLDSNFFKSSEVLESLRKGNKRGGKGGRLEELKNILDAIHFVVLRSKKI